MAWFRRREQAPAALPDQLRPLADRGVRLPGAVTTHELAPDLTVWSVPVRGDAAGIDLWLAVRHHHPATGVWPVLAASDTWDATAWGRGAHPPAPDEEAAARWLEAELAAAPPFPAVGSGPFTPGDPARWREDSPLRLDTPDRLLLVPAPGGWAVPGLLGWEGAPLVGVPGDGHGAFLHRWADRFGAELVMLGSETMSLRVTRPPRSPADAVAAARELVVYCPDTVGDAGLAPDAVVALVASPTWWLLWD